LTETLTERHSKAFFPPLLEGPPPVHFGKSRAASLQKRDARVEMHGRYSSAGSDVGSDAGQSWILGVGGQQLQDCVLLSGVSGGDIEPRAGCAGGPPWSRASSSAVMMSDSDLEIGAETELDLAEYLGGIMPTTAWAGERRPVGDRSGTGSELEVAGDPRGVEAPERTPNTRLQEVLDDISSPESSESSPRTLRGEPADAQNGDVGGVSPPGGTPWHFSAPRHEIIQDRPQRNTATAPIEDRLVRCEALLRARERSVSEQAEQIEALSQKLETMGGERDDMARRCSDWEAAHIRLAEEEQRLQQELSRANSTISVLQAQGSELREEVAAGKLAIDEMQQRVDSVAGGDSALLAAKYEHHLAELSAEHRLALARAGEEAEGWRAEALALRALDALQHAQEPNSVHDAGTQAELAPHAGPEIGEGHKAALLARIDALEGELRALALQHTCPLRASEAAPVDISDAPITTELIAECQTLAELNTSLIAANRRLAAANEKLLAERGLACRPGDTSGPESLETQCDPLRLEAELAQLRSELEAEKVLAAVE